MLGGAEEEIEEAARGGQRKEEGPAGASRGVGGGRGLHPTRCRRGMDGQERGRGSQDSEAARARADNVLGNVYQA